MRCLAVLLLGAALAAPVVAQSSVRRDTFALAPGQASARLAARPIVGTEAVAVFRDTAFVPLPYGAYELDGAGVLRLASTADTVRFVAIAYRAAPVVGPVRAALPSADSLRALYAPDTTTGRRRAPPVLARPPPAIQTRGSITRGVVAGSNRDVSVTSALRLSLQGEVSPGVTLRAALTDEDTPILPEGTTRQLSDLDRVYVEVDGPGVGARLGDVDLALTGTAFAPLARQVQGAVVETRLPRLGVVRGGRALASASATRGRFRSQDVVALEGVQGPYRLEGVAGQAFVVVVPGSERVYLDGRRLVRGAGGDYTIDYGTGEVTFTAARLITAERRITVDFEYTDGGFTRTLVASGLDLDLGDGLAGADGPRGRLGVRVFREADVLGSAADIGLGPDDLDRIRAAGDADVLVPSAQPVAFDPASPFVLYTRRDTTENGAPARVFVPAQPDDAEVFRVRFTRVGAGRGAYRRAGAARNGIFYEYVGPGLGDSVPGRILPRPASRTLVDVAGQVDVVPGLAAFAELARSVDDANALSPVGDGDDGAGAYQAGLRLADVAVGGGALSGEVVRRDRADAFRPLDRVRDVEFNRRWNLARAGTPFGSVVDSLGETVTEGRLRWLGSGLGARAEAGRLDLGGFRSTRAAAAVSLGAGGLGEGALGVDGLDDGRPTAGAFGQPGLAVEAAVSETGGAGPVADLLGTGAFRRGQAVGSLAWGLARPSLAVEHERRTQAGGAIPQDAELSASYAFTAVRPGLAVATGALEAGASVELRRESEPLGPEGQELADAARAVTVEASGRWRGAAVQSDGRVAYRRKRYGDDFRLLGRQDAESVALRLSSRANAAGGAVDGRVVYDALTERAPLLQETYVLVGQDLGEFVWRDGQGEPRAGEPDGIAQVDEFFPETTPLEGTYLRTFVPGTDLVPTVGVGLGLTLNLRPGRIASGTGALARALDAVALRTVVDVRERTRERDVLRVLLLSPSVLQSPGLDGEPATLDGRFRVEQEAVLFPDTPDRGARLAVDHSRTTSRLAAGLERRLTQTARAEAYRPLGPVEARLALVAGRRRATSETFASRTFDLRSLGVEGSARWSPGRVALTLAPTVASRTDALAAPGRPAGAFVVRLPVEARWTRSGRFSAAARAELSSVRLRGGQGGGLSLFELTDGRGPGTSVLWGADAQVGLTDRVRGSLVYDGRAPADARVVQTVRVQLTATL